VDVAPLVEQDPLGTNPFYLIVSTSLSGYMVVIVLGQVWAGARLRTRDAAVEIVARPALLNVPSAGLHCRAACCPAFWQGVHSVYFGAGGFEAMRSVVYFGGAGAGR
jgi:hypothetical protein